MVSCPGKQHDSKNRTQMLSSESLSPLQRLLLVNASKRKIWEWERWDGNDGTVRGLCGAERVKVTSQAVAFRGVVLGSVT